MKESESTDIKNLGELIIAQEELFKKISSLKDEVARNNQNIDINSQDARLVTLSMLLESILVNLVFFRLIEKYKPNDEDLRSLFYLKSNVDLHFIDKIVNRVLIISLLDEFYFVLDNFMQNILLFLEINTKIGFNPYVSALKEKYALDLQTFECLGQLRNSFHNNGIHAHKNKQFKINGLEYIFNKNIVHLNGSWDYVLNLLTYLVIDLREILLIPNLISTDFIPDESNKQYDYTKKDSESFISDFIIKKLINA